MATWATGQYKTIGNMARPLHTRRNCRRKATESSVIKDNRQFFGVKMKETLLVIILLASAACGAKQSSRISETSSETTSISNADLAVTGPIAADLFNALVAVGAEQSSQGPDESVVKIGPIDCNSVYANEQTVVRCKLAANPADGTSTSREISGEIAKTLFTILYKSGVEQFSRGFDKNALIADGVVCDAKNLAGVVYNCKISLKTTELALFAKCFDTSNDTIVVGEAFATLYSDGAHIFIKSGIASTSESLLDRNTRLDVGMTLNPAKYNPLSHWITWTQSIEPGVESNFSLGIDSIAANEIGSAFGSVANGHSAYPWCVSFR
jgi:hypothetical protein